MEKNIWIWGYSDIGKLAHKAILCEGKWSIKGIIDNDPHKRKDISGGILIYSFDEAKVQIENSEVVVCCCREENYETFKKALKNIGHENYIFFSDLNMHPLLFQFMEEGYDKRIVSRCCSQEDFYTSEFQSIVSELHEKKRPSQYHRKLWEYVFIIRALKKYGMLQEGKRGLGFAVGLEPLPSFFAHKKISVLATDLSADDEQSRAWVKTAQNAGGNLSALYRDGVCSREEFEQYVSFRAVNMNEIPPNIGLYDFCWSSCAIEHVGGLKRSKQFLKNMIGTLKPGGVAVHTTEFNLSSNDDTIEKGGSIIYRKKDIEEMKEWFSEHGCSMETSYRRGVEE